MKFIKCVLIFFIIISISPLVLADDLIELETEAITVNSTSDIEPKIYSHHVIVFERNSKMVLYEKNSNEKCKMASTTKIMTCTLILENCNLDDVVTVSSKSANTGGSRLGLHTGDNITVRDLLHGLMLCSGNDTAVALAEHCSGSVEEFANLMNKKAQELALSSTNFVTPHGLDNDNHYTTAYDFAILTDYALNNPQFLQIVGTKYCDVAINGVSKSIHNTNELLGAIQSVYGVKTGYTSQAGRCLISAAKQDNLDIIVVVLGADTKKIRTEDSINLINYIFSNYEIVDLQSLLNEKYTTFENYILPYITVTKAASSLQTKLDNIPLQYYPVLKSNLNSIQLSIHEEKTLEAPIMENQKIAEINISINNNKICSTNIVSSTYINRKNSIDYLYYFITNYKNFYQVQ